jgi:hypothetical protein
VADDTIDAAEKTGPRGHAYDNNGNRVTCLPATGEPLEDMCFCGHIVVAASEIGLAEGMSDHETRMRATAAHG